MQIPNITHLLETTLNPALIHQAESSLLNERQRQGFITNLLIISDNPQCSIPIRQAALINIKNAIIADYNKVINLPDNDFDTIKSSILQALIRNCQQKSITPSIREIIYVLAEHQFPQNWQQIIPEIANNIQNSGDFSQIFGSIEALKAIVSAIVKKVDSKVTLENLCNKIVLPLLSLASKLFQNYNDTTSFILISIFKIFSTVTNFHIPEIVILNMHSWMIFVKKLLDLNIEAGNIDMNMYQLKKICLRIMFRFYQRHLNKKFSIAAKNVIDEFHQKFTKGITQSLLLQIINESHLAKNSTNKNYIQLTKHSLACLSYIYEEDRNSALIIDHYREKIIYLCLERYKTKLNKEYSSYGNFSSKLNEQRAHFCQFIKALIKNQSKTEEQAAKGNYNYFNSFDAIAILGCLYGHIQKGDMEMKELCLYIYSNIASSLSENDSEIQSKMLTFILNIVKPLLSSQDTPTIIKLRCCEILSKYSYIQIPESELTQIGGGVYGCLISTSNHPNSASMETFLQIQSVYAFNSLLRYDFIINFTSTYLSNILQVYTSLLQIEMAIIKCLEDMLGKFQPYLQPYGNDLIEMLTQMFFKYHELGVKNKSGQSYQLNLKAVNEDVQDSDQQEGNQSSDNNYLNASKACLGAIRQIIQVPEFVLQKDQLIHTLLISIFSDKEMLNTEEGFNILNQILFKSKNLKQQYNIYFSLIMFGIIPVNQNYINILKNQNSTYSNTLFSMLQCQCTNPDLDFIENTVGCIRNFISKYQNNLRNQIDKSGVSFLDLILNAVKYVHENQSTKADQSQRSIILTLYISLIQWKTVNDQQMKQILLNVTTWLNMEKELIESNQSVQVKPKNPFQQQATSKKEDSKKIIYCPIYMQIILLACHFYPDVTFNVLNGNWISGQLLLNWQRFHVDYQLSRLLIGVADLFNCQSVSEQNLSSQIINRIPEVIEKVCKIRLGQDNNDLQSDDEEAEEEKYFGMDENTHIMGWNKPNVIQKPNQNQEEMDEEDSFEEDEEDQEFNKYYESPLDNIDEITYITNVLRNGQCQAYMNLMRNDLQQKLSFLILNAPSKFNSNKND